jgi:hypothetical protein
MVCPIIGAIKFRIISYFLLIFLAFKCRNFLGSNKRTSSVFCASTVIRGFIYRIWFANSFFIKTVRVLFTCRPKVIHFGIFPIALR